MPFLGNRKTWTGVTGKQCPWIAIRLPALLVEGIPQAPMNAEFHSAAARPTDAFSHALNIPGHGFFSYLNN